MMSNFIILTSQAPVPVRCFLVSWSMSGRYLFNSNFWMVRKNLLNEA